VGPELYKALMKIKHLLVFLTFSLLAYGANSNATIDMWISKKDIRVRAGIQVIVRDEVEELVGYVLDRDFKVQDGYEYHLYVDLDPASERIELIDGKSYVTFNSRIETILEARKMTESQPSDSEGSSYFRLDVESMRKLLVAGGYRLTKYTPEQQTQMRFLVLKAMLPVQLPEFGESLKAPQFQPAINGWAEVTAQLWAQPGPDRLAKIINVTTNRLTATQITDKCALALTMKRPDRDAFTAEKDLVDKFHNSIDALRAILPPVAKI
jgi:hypothetical protein